MANTGKRAKKVLLAVVGLLTLGILTLVGITAYTPLPLPFIDSYLRGLLDQNYYSYGIEFEDARAQWHLIDGIVELQLSNVQARDLGGEVIASVPQIDIGLDLAAVMQGNIKLSYLRIKRARIGLYRTVGGAVKFDIGGRSDGAAGKILENLLIDIASAPALTEGKVPDFPTISVIDTEFEIGDEASGADLWIPKAQVHLKSTADGVRGDYVLEVATGGERLRLSAVSLFSTADQRTDLVVELDGVRPAIVGEILPNLGFFTPIEVPFSGSIKVELDKFLTISHMTFDLVGEKGSLEIADYGGVNLAVKSARAVGKVGEALSYVELTDLRFILKEGEIAVQGLVFKDGPTYSFGLDLAISGNNPVGLFPRWFAQVETAPSWKEGGEPAGKQAAEIAFDGRYDQQRNHLVGTGIISSRALGGRSNRSRESGPTSETQDIATLWFLVEGPIDAPNVLITPIDTISSDDGE